MDFSSKAIRRRNLALAINAAFFPVIALVFAVTGGGYYTYNFDHID